MLKQVIFFSKIYLERGWARFGVFWFVLELESLGFPRKVVFRVTFQFTFH